MRAIRYKIGTQSGPFSRAELDEFARMMRVDQRDFQFDEDYKTFLQAHNGGEPTKRLFRAAGQWYELERFLNFADSSQASDSDLMFNVQQNWNLIEDRLEVGMFPCATLHGGDYLVFDHSAGEPASIRLWSHERSTENHPHLIPVADDFVSFVDSLRSTKS